MYVMKTGYEPGLIGDIARLHARYYHQHWGFGAFFEAKVASELSEFVARYDPQRDCLWRLVEDDALHGTITVDGGGPRDEGAHIRWFITSDAARGGGHGRQLLESAVDFCREGGHGKTYLWTFEGLDAARHLYESLGFRMVEQHSGEQWGSRVQEQRFELVL